MYLMTFAFIIVFMHASANCCYTFAHTHTHTRAGAILRYMRTRPFASIQMSHYPSHLPCVSETHKKKTKIFIVVIYLKFANAILVPSLPIHVHTKFCTGI